MTEDNLFFFLDKKHDGFLDVLLPGHTRFSSELAPFPVASM